MARETFIYGETRPLTRTFEGYDADKPEAGYYAMKLRSGGVRVGIHIWHGPPHDPVTGEEMDRSWRWQATANGEQINLERVWPQCGREPIDQNEHDYLCRLQAWGREHDPEGALANPARQSINHLTAPVTF